MREPGRGRIGELYILACVLERDAAKWPINGVKECVLYLKQSYLVWGGAEVPCVVGEPGRGGVLKCGSA